MIDREGLAGTTRLSILGGDNRGVPQVYGTGAPGARIELSASGRRHGALVDECGCWSVRVPGLSPGAHTLRAVQCDANDVLAVEGRIELPEPVRR